MEAESNPANGALEGGPSVMPEIHVLTDMPELDAAELTPTEASESVAVLVTGNVLDEIPNGKAPSEAAEVTAVTEVSASGSPEMPPEMTLTGPQREPLLFLYDPASVDTDMAQVMESIKQLAEKMLYHWKMFPIVLPESVTESVTLKLPDDSALPKKGPLSFKDLFIAPTFDELEEVCKDKSGNQKKLTDKQILSVWDTGEFEVESIHFPGQIHRWRLSQLLQKGTKRAQDTLLSDAALALRLMIITARNRIHSHFFSLSNSVTGWHKGLWKLIDILIGMPSTSTGDIMSAVREEHMRYLVAELDIKPNCRREFNTFCTYVKEKCEVLRAEKHKTTDLRPPPIPYSYETPKGQDIDLRLFNKDLMNRCLPILQTLLENESKGWHIQYRLKLIRDFKDQGFSTDAISEKVTKAVMDEYLKRAYHAILTSSELEDRQRGIGQLLVDQAKSMLAMEEANRKVFLKMKKHRDQLVVHLEKFYPVKSRITAWRNEQIRAFEEEFISQNLWSAHEEAISICEEESLAQTVYFLRRDLAFIKEREPILKKEFGKIKIPNRVFSFATRIWLPGNWIIMRHYRAETEVIQTFITGKPAQASPVRTSPREESYTVEKYQHRKTTTRYPFWRWWNYIHRTWAWTWNAMFWLGIIIPWCSPLSLRALFYRKSFMPNLKLSQTDGALYPDEGSLTHTLLSRLYLLWDHVRTSRSKFEEAPDTGFLGKSLSRHINRFWNYVIKGAFGSVALVTVLPVVCVSVSLTSALLAATSPFWMPVVTIAVHLGFFLVYDADAPEEETNRFTILLEAVLYRLVLQGCLQPVAALFVALVCCPLSALAISLFGVIRRGGRGLWDTIMFHAMIKKRGRVPARNGFVARRIAGPGLASNYFFQITPEQALAALEAKLELEELKAWEAETRNVMEQPVHEFRDFISQCFKPFSASIEEAGVFKHLLTETKLYQEDLKSKVNKCMLRLHTGLTHDLQMKIKLPEKELKVVILSAAKLLEHFYPVHILARLSIPESEFWENHLLEDKDWTGLACRLFMEIFSKSFLVPLEEADNQFELKVEHLNLGRYVDMLKTGDIRDDLDSVIAVHAPSGDITVTAPYLDEAFFNPSPRAGDHTSNRALRRRLHPWKSVRNDIKFQRLEIPLPVPHPASISVSIYNREHDRNPIKFEDMYCQRIIRATKEVPYVDIGEPLELSEAEPSTPDNTYEPVGTISHLAEEERSFSEESVVVSRGSPRLHDKGLPRKLLGAASLTKSEAATRTDKGQIVYEEKEMDNRCVVTIDEVSED